MCIRESWVCASQMDFSVKFCCQMLWQFLGAVCVRTENPYKYLIFLFSLPLSLSRSVQISFEFLVYAMGNECQAKQTCPTVITVWMQTTSLSPVSCPNWVVFIIKTNAHFRRHILSNRVYAHCFTVLQLILISTRKKSKQPLGEKDQQWPFPVDDLAKMKMCMNLSFQNV